MLRYAIALLVVASSCAHYAAACSCNYGAVDIEEPQCVCACFPTYLQPNCRYTATESVSIGIYVRLNTSSFDAFNMTSTLTWALGVSSPSSITFKFARATSAPSMTYARYLLRGDYAQQLNWDFYSSNSWLTSVGIVSVWEEGALGDTSGIVDVDSSMVLFESSDKTIVITVGTIAWALAALICTGIMACIENLFMHNTEGEVESLRALMDEQQQQMRIMRAQRRGVHNGQVQHQHQGTVVNGVRQISVMPTTEAKNPLDY